MHWDKPQGKDVFGAAAIALEHRIAQWRVLMQANLLALGLDEVCDDA